ncbi:TIGR03086 family protein [Nakamurella silvestris]|nr:TIGR03086 family protein [Nakamurella silvestris]
MTDTHILEGVLDKTAAIVAGVAPADGGRPTPCTEHDVNSLVGHIVAWVRVFANGPAGDEQPADPEAYVSTDPAGDFRAAAAKAVAAYQALPDDAPVRLSSGSMPAAASVAMMTGEYLAHGWDLAKATGQPIPYTDEEAEVAQEGLAPLLAPEYRGDGMPFGEIVEVPDTASGLDRFIGFSGRNPDYVAG